MDVAQIIVTMGGVLLIGLTLWFFFGRRNEPGPKGGRYACPMHPWVTSDDPAADCSVCGMKLVLRDGKG